LPNLQPNSPAIGQKYGEKCAAAVDLQPTTSKSDRLLGHGWPDAMRLFEFSNFMIQINCNLF
jgi:hypothetical protein